MSAGVLITSCRVWLLTRRQHVRICMRQAFPPLVRRGRGSRSGRRTFAVLSRLLVARLRGSRRRGIKNAKGLSGAEGALSGLR